MKNDKFLKICNKNCMCYYCDDIIKLDYFDIDNISIDEKLHKNILFFI